MTTSQGKALKWLFDRGADGIFDIHGIVIAHGEIAPITRSTWNALRDLGYIEFYNPTGKGRGRLRITNEGMNHIIR